MWIDTHCHPFDKRFKDDRKEMIQRARAAGVEKMIVVGYSPSANREVLDLVKRYDFMWGALGIHPSESFSDEELWRIKAETAENDKIVAIGEIGLDYYRNRTSPDKQKYAFKRQIALAKELDLPIVLHSRDAAEDTLAVLREEGAKRAVFHCYPYDLPFAKKAWEEDYYISFAGILTYPNSGALKEVAEYARIDRILIETDCPYLAPQKYRGQRNEMAYVVEVGKELARLRGISENDLAKQLAENTKNFFGV